MIPCASAAAGPTTTPCARVAARCPHPGRPFHGMHRHGLRRTLAVLLAGVLAAVPAASQDLSDVLPELKTLPVPPSVGEGLRLNYLVEVATVPTAFFYEWVNDAGSTNHYNLPSPSGRGRTQVDVIGVAPAYVALRVQPWLYHNFTGPLVPLFGGEEALISHAGGGDWYAHPAALAKVAETLQPGLRILRMPLSVAGRLYRALRIQREIRGAQAVVCYDLDTGYLIYKAASVTGKQGVTVSQASFTGSRRISLPWLTGRLPSWTALRPTLRYEGSHTAVAPGPFPYTLPLSAEVAITAATANWFLYEQTTTLGSLPGMPDTVETKTLASGIPSTSPLCLPVPAPDTLRPGDQLDADDVTGAVLTVTHVGTLASGRHGVVLHLRVGDVAWAETAYDGATGVAVELRTYSGASPIYYTTTELRLSALPPSAPAIPRLSLERLGPGNTLLLSWNSEAARRYTVESSTDAGHTWNPLAGAEDREGTGQLMSVELAARGTHGFYRVAAR